MNEVSESRRVESDLCVDVAENEDGGRVGAIMNIDVRMAD